MLLYEYKFKSCVVYEERDFFVKNTSGSCWFYKTKVFPHWKNLWSLQKAHQKKKKRTQKLLVKVTRGYLQDNIGNSKFEQIWMLQDIFFRSTQNQLPVPFPSLKSNTRRTGIKIVWRLLAKRVWKSSFEDLSTVVNLKNRFI